MMAILQCLTSRCKRRISIAENWHPHNFKQEFPEFPDVGAINLNSASVRTWFGAGVQRQFYRPRFTKTFKRQMKQPQAAHYDVAIQFPGSPEAFRVWDRDIAEAANSPNAKRTVREFII
ncbi:hypothetical protein C8F04DRAFT_1187918 [Mycena alexandri]|uniref:Uncharacterized protein n=1 Tax=Mycena alexandri TaxID=1745969 RepID=A0AAD6WVP8_9AGAR|nr:hypothetical protein C8F04DRAFT_1187918 [Mycena alexandri]